MTHRMGRVCALVCLLLLALLMTSCGSKAEDSTASVAGDSRDGQSRQPAGEAVSNLNGVREAVIRIEAQGTFIDPEFGLQENAAGSGSGFIIDPSGIAVTNNHVVTGAALLRVYVHGESEPRNAKILGVSECSDLAVIDIDGEGFSFLDWYQGDVDVGLEVYAAGYPLGDPEFTLTRGIVSKARADGESSWASVNYVLEHDATINPGNSGGPLVDENGRVVGVNYAVSLIALNQFFAIKADEALDNIEIMRRGDDVDTIGINGVAVVNDDGSISGIWVSSVKSGSSADLSGVEGGDIITTLEGLVLATDGTMSDYCDILRTHEYGDTLGIEVLRYATSELLEGQINGRALATVFTFGEQSGGETSGGETTGDGETTGGYSRYVTVKDDTGVIQVDIPAEWSDVDGRPLVDDNDEVIGASIWAAPDVTSFSETWATPGMVFELRTNVSEIGGHMGLLDTFTEDFNAECSFVERDTYTDELYEGMYDLYENCGGIASYLLLAVVPSTDPQAFVMNIEVQIVSDADWDAVERILGSFQTSEVPPAPDYTGEYASITDDYYSIQVDVPSAWTDIDGSPWIIDGEVFGASVWASTDLTAFGNWQAPGVAFSASDDLAKLGGYIQVLDVYREIYLDSCELFTREDYEDTLYRGKYDLFTQCGGVGGSDFLVLSAVSKDDQFAFIIVVQIVIKSEADWDALFAILDSFTVIGTLP